MAERALWTLELAHSHWDGWGAGWWVAMMVGMVLFWGLIVLGAVWVVRELVLRGRSGGAGHDGDRETPLETLDRRLAAGEITAEEYRERRELLGGSTGREAKP